MRWLYHLRPVGAEGRGRYAPPSVTSEGFLHASYRDALLESARLYFAKDAAIEFLRIDPRRLDVPVERVETPRGEMPHIRGSIPEDAMVERAPLASFDPHRAPDLVLGTRFAFVAFSGMTLLDLVGVLDPLARIAAMGFDPTSTCEVVAAHEGPLWCDNGASFSAARVRPPLDPFDVLVVPGGPGTRTVVHDADVVPWLASFPSNRLVASVCTGALLLGAAGRLRGKRATTHRLSLAALAAYGATVEPRRVVDDGQVVTAGGVTSALDLGLHLVERLVTPEAAEAIAGQMEYARARA
jgi:putative intracellular protease/amidase/uncharacterized protein (DUF952 family)